MVKFTGETVDEAIEKGLSTLEITRTKASIRVLSSGKKGFLGIGKTPAEVDVEIISHSTVSKADRDIVRRLPRSLQNEEVSEEAIKQEKIEARKVTSIINYLEKRGNIVNDNVKSEMLDARRSVTSVLTDLLPDEIVEEYRRKKEELEEKGLDWEDEIDDQESLEVELETTSVTELDSAEDNSASQAPSQESSSLNQEDPDQTSNLSSPEKEKASKPIEEASQAVKGYLESLLEHMDIEAQVLSSHTRRQVTLQVETSQPGRVIGYHGKVLKSLQIVTQNLLHDQFSRHYSVVINVQDYVERRTETLRDYTTKIAQEVIETGQAYTMDTMTNDERKIVHKTIATIEGVESTSEGDDPKRYIVIRPTHKA